MSKSTVEASALLGFVDRTETRVRDRTYPGWLEVFGLLVAQSAASLATGTRQFGQWWELLAAAAVVAVGGVVLLLGFRSRTGLGVPIRAASWAVPVLLFALEVAANLGFDGSNRRIAVALAFAACAWLQGALLRSELLVLVGGAPLIIAVATILGWPAAVSVSVLAVYAGGVVFRGYKAFF